MHGFSGKVKAAPTGDADPALLLEAGTVRAGGRELEVEESSFSGKAFVLKFKGIDSEGSARALIGADLALEGLPEPPKGAVWVADLKGIKVQDEAGAELGEVTGVYPTGANDVYEVQPPEGPSFLVPAVKEFVLKIDLKAKVMKVKLIPGLK